jgi:FkbM family methyltransferase
MKDYSQHGEQPIILSYFKSIGLEKGNVLSIGENDGETLSNVRALLLAGWGGYLFEPSNNAHYKLDKLYRNADDIYCEKFAISTKDGRQVFHESGPHITDQDSSLISTLKQSELGRWKGTKYDNFTQTEVETITYKTFMSWAKIKTFDFINIDAEGMDLEILRQIDLNEVECKLICVEYNGNHIERHAMTEYVKKFGFVLHWSNQINLIFRKA